jgi:nicotinamidase-related amidase
MERVLPVVTAIAGRFPERTIFTRFITPHRPDQMPGSWQRYYQKWRSTTREQMDPRLLDLLPALARFAPPAAVVDKTRYSAFSAPRLLPLLTARQADGLIVTGSETDVCILATIMSAVDLGFRVILVRDAVCSSSDTGHDALLDLYHRRYSEQIETASAEDVLARWR